MGLFDVLGHKKLEIDFMVYLDHASYCQNEMHLFSLHFTYFMIVFYIRTEHQVDKSLGREMLFDLK